MMRLISPYTNQGIWLRGSLHIHSKFSACGFHSLPEIALAYRDYDFLAITDHDRVTDRESAFPDKILFRGYEASGARHMLLIEPPFGDELPANSFSCAHYNNMAAEAAACGGFSIINHPTRISGQAWSFEEILQMPSVHAMEIYSGDGIHIEEDVAVRLWDKVLSAKRQIWGIGNDDFHHWGQERRVWNVVQAEERTPTAVLRALRNGNFYVSTGYGFDAIEVDGADILFRLKSGSSLFTEAYKYFTLFGRDGKVLAEKTGYFQEFHYQASGDEGYIRAEVYLSGGYCGISQPIFVA
ncbi:CehA/McbA family metallohydrolase domain-containing protein [Parablautia muri]|nr:phosphoesterase [Parablautia muri]